MRFSPGTPPGNFKLSYVLDAAHPETITEIVDPYRSDGLMNIRIPEGQPIPGEINIRACAESDGHRWSKDFKIVLNSAASSPPGGRNVRLFGVDERDLPAVPSIFARGAGH